MAGVLDKETTYLHTDATIQEVAAHVAYYNLTAAPVRFDPLGEAVPPIDALGRAPAPTLFVDDDLGGLLRAGFDITGDGEADLSFERALPLGAHSHVFLTGDPVGGYTVTFDAAPGGVMDRVRTAAP